MKLRLTLILFCLLGIGLFARSQDKKNTKTQPTVENGADAIPVTVQSTKKPHRKPPPPSPLLIKNGKPSPPPKVEFLKLTPPKIAKDAPKPPPPHKPTNTIPLKPIPPDAPPPAAYRT